MQKVFLLLHRGIIQFYHLMSERRLTSVMSTSHSKIKPGFYCYWCFLGEVRRRVRACFSQNYLKYARKLQKLLKTGRLFSHMILLIYPS